MAIRAYPTISAGTEEISPDTARGKTAVFRHGRVPKGRMLAQSGEVSMVPAERHPMERNIPSRTMFTREG